MQTSDQITELSAALCKAQASMEAAAKDSKNPHFNSKYADLASVWEACREPLTSNGLSVLQCPENTDDGVAIRSRLMHTSGQWIESLLVIPLERKTAQSVGSAITYGRRYALSAMVGVCPDDDDGNAATGNGDDKKRPAAKTQRKDPDEEPATVKKQEAAFDYDKLKNQLLTLCDLKQCTPLRSALTGHYKEGRIDKDQMQDCCAILFHFWAKNTGAKNLPGMRDTIMANVSETQHLRESDGKTILTLIDSRLTELEHQQDKVA